MKSFKSYLPSFIITAVALVAGLIDHTLLAHAGGALLGSALTFPFDQDGKLRGAKFTDRGCLACPTGSAFSSDDALSVLERATNNILMKGFKDYEQPMFPLANREIRAAAYQQMGNRAAYRYHVFYPETHRAKFYDPMPSLQNYDVTRQLIAQCGGDLATAQLIANSNSLGCAPPRGDRGITGKDAYSNNAATAVFELGPFCTTNYLELYDFAALLSAYKTAAIRAAGMALEYEKIRRFVDMSMKNASAVAGTTRPRFFSGRYGEMPTSPGSFEWILNAIDMGIGGEVPTNREITVKCSSQLLKYWIMKYQKDHNVEIHSDFSKVKIETQGFIASFEGADFVMTSLRTNRRVRFTNNVMPVYVEVYATGDEQGEWDFQPFYVTEPGDDARDGQANGFRQSMNTAYGDATNYCEGVPKRLAEQILIDVDAFHYEAFPTNPLGTMIDKNVEANLQRLWGTTEIDWAFGTEVQLYYLDKMNAMLEGTGAPCFSNRDRTWFAGKIKTGLQFVEDAPRQMMSLLCAVPAENFPLEKSEQLLPAAYPAEIQITARPAKEGPELCTPYPYGSSEDAEGPGCALVPKSLRFQLPTSGDRTVTLTFMRKGGTTGALTVPFSRIDDTALNGTHYNLTNGNMVFADGEESATITLTLHSVMRNGASNPFVHFQIAWDNSPVVLCDGMNEFTDVCLQLAEEAAEEATCPYPEGS